MSKPTIFHPNRLALTLYLAVFLLSLRLVFFSLHSFLLPCPDLIPRLILFNIYIRAKPTSVHDLRFDDISVIAALVTNQMTKGDSITAALVAKAPSRFLVNSTFENRGVSFAIGGDKDAITLPNIIKRFNPNIIGASIGDHRIELCQGTNCLPYQYVPELDRLNAAQSGAMGIVS